MSEKSHAGDARANRKARARFMHVFGPVSYVPAAAPSRSMPGMWEVSWRGGGSAVRERVAELRVARHLVVATGGGTFADPQNRAVILGDGLSVWLDVPIHRLIARVPADGRRPLSAHDTPQGPGRITALPTWRPTRHRLPQHTR